MQKMKKKKRNKIKEKNKNNFKKLVDYIGESDLSWLAAHIVCVIGKGKVSIIK
jgi:hypothetical protein